ncbi:tetratricopeptide repeat protein [Candidatus Thorarchaeota archaeon]|nr:MAG: tetratricopeptide repeat protein [Candidatus Thorarchaeota archaeon]
MREDRLTSAAIPPEFTDMKDRSGIPWEKILKGYDGRRSKGEPNVSAFTDVVIEIASKESMKRNPNPNMLSLGMKACLTRGRLAEGLFISTESRYPEVLSLSAIIYFVLSDVEGLGRILSKLEKIVSEESEPSDKIRLSSVRVLQAAAERDTSVTMCVMEFDNLLETYPQQVEDPLTETMFALYVVGSLLREIGEANRASRICDTLEDMAERKDNRMFIALTENLRGNICNLKGDFDAAEEHYLRVKEISQDLSFELGLGIAYNNLGTLHTHSLRIEEAVEYFEMAYEHMETDATKLAPLANLAELCTIMGMYDKAEEYLEEGMRIEKKTKQGMIEVFSLNAILLSLTGRHDEALEYLKEASRIAESSDKPLQIGAYYHADGVFNASRSNWQEAVSSFEKALKIGRDNAAFEILVKAELELARTYMKAYEQEDDDEFLASAAYHLDDLIQIAKEQGLKTLYAEVLLLRSDVFRFANKKLEAKGDIDRALSLANYVEDSRLAQQAQHRMDLLEGRIERDSAREVGVSNLMDRVSGFKPAAQMKDVPKPTIRALIALDRGSGIPQFVHYFDVELQVDSSIVSGFISAIMSFTSEMMGTKGLLRSIGHEGFTLLMEHTETRTVALIADEESFDLRYLLREFSNRFDEMFPPKETDGVSRAEYEKGRSLAHEIFL